MSLWGYIAWRFTSKNINLPNQYLYFWQMTSKSCHCTPIRPLWRSSNLNVKPAQKDSGFLCLIPILCLHCENSSHLVTAGFCPGVKKPESVGRGIQTSHVDTAETLSSCEHICVISCRSCHQIAGTWLVNKCSDNLRTSVSLVHPAMRTLLNVDIWHFESKLILFYAYVTFGYLPFSTLPLFNT